MKAFGWLVVMIFALGAMAALFFTAGMGGGDHPGMVPWVQGVVWMLTFGIAALVSLVLYIGVLILRGISKLNKPVSGGIKVDPSGAVQGNRNEPRHLKNVRREPPSLKRPTE